MRRSRPSIATLLLTTALCSVVSRSSSAEDPLPPELAGKVTILTRGAKAPTDGILLTRQLLVDLLKAAERRVRAAETATERGRRDAEALVAAGRASAEAEVAAANARADAALADQLRRERIYEDAIARAGASPPWWRSSLFVGALGAVVGGGICAGSVAAGR